MTQKDERTWAIFISLAGIIGMTIGLISPVGNIIAVLVLWLIKREQSTFLDTEGKEALNFQITMSLAALIVNMIFFFIGTLWTLSTFWWMSYSPNFSFRFVSGRNGIVWLINVIFSIIATIKASNGEVYRYPINLRLVK
ncbi:DUF4870 domain-containing protein [Chitinophaga sancti]|uniref:DUF4870 domain-containing protein n=1 Tax=Chitinophaga sancti TaxID=1004 RepID=UPI002A754865|nr:DUF4870 domain-containing protein [Chitinophaga sancti]WPQ60987.1 DUF4870 domain-containing protein [Chitinophaga sancti]